MHVLIGTDGSPLALDAAERGAALLGNPDHVTLLTVLSGLPGDDAGGIEGPVLSADEQEEEWKAENDEARTELERTAGRLHATQIEERIEVGDVAGAICKTAADLGVDAIVVGSHERSALGR